MAYIINESSTGLTTMATFGVTYAWRLSAWDSIYIIYGPHFIFQYQWVCKRHWGTIFTIFIWFKWSQTRYPVEYSYFMNIDPEALGEDSASVFGDRKAAYLYSKLLCLAHWRPRLGFLLFFSMGDASYLFQFNSLNHFNHFNGYNSTMYICIINNVCTTCTHARCWCDWAAVYRYPFSRNFPFDQ